MDAAFSSLFYLFALSTCACRFEVTSRSVQSVCNHSDLAQGVAMNITAFMRSEGCGARGMRPRVPRYA